MISKWYAAVWLGAFLAVPMWTEFREPNHLIWNVFLATFLIGVVAAAFLGLRHLERNQVSVGEARFKAPRQHSDGR